MLFVNATPLQATVVPNAEEGDDIAMLVVAAITYRVLAGAQPREALSLAKTQRPLIIGMEGESPGDDVFVRTGVSVGATGFVHAPGGEAKRGEAKLSVGGAERTVAAFGARVWQRGALGLLTPSAPRPFQTIPMLWQHAFGGTFYRPAEIRDEGGREYYVPGFQDPYAFNPDGTGYYRDDQHAEEQPLPFLEDEAHLVSRWDDRPPPLCFAPYTMRGALRVLSAVVDGKVDFNRAGNLTHRAVPRLTFAEIPEGTLVSLTGMRPDGEILAFEVPPAPAFIDISLAERSARVELGLDTIEIDAARGEVRLVYRKIFRYPLLEGELRVARLEGTARLTEDVKNLQREG